MTAPDETSQHKAFTEWVAEEAGTSHGREFCQVFDVMVDPNPFGDSEWRQTRERWAKIDKDRERWEKLTPEEQRAVTEAFR
jgi:TRAP-type C4-dicarboxylate transport system substrate-binding protein